MSYIPDRITDCVEYKIGYHQGRADGLYEIKPFIDELQNLSCDWICDDLCGEFVNPKTDESWCNENCKEFNFECVKKWCELVRLKEPNDDQI